RRPQPQGGDERLASAAARFAAKLPRRAVCASSHSGNARGRPAQGCMTMRHVSALLTRELAAYFLGPMAYLVLLGFQVIAFLNFWELVDTLSQRRQEYSSLRDPMSAYISGSPAFWIAIVVAIPLLTMRLMAEERRSGTI